MGRFVDLIDETKPRAGMALRFAVEESPDDAADVSKLSRRYGVPAGVVSEFRDDYRTQAKTDDGRAVLDRSPRLRDFIAENPDSAKVMHDDLENMGALEMGFAAFRKAWSVGFNVRGSIAAAVPSVISGAAGVATAAADVAYDAERRVFEAFGRDAPFGDQSPVSRAARGVAVAAKRTAEDWAPKVDNWMEQAAYSGVQSATQSLMFAPFGAVGVIGGLSAVTGGQSYIKATEFDPADPSKKVLGTYEGLGYAAIDAGIEAATELLPTKRLFKDLAAGTGAGKMLVRNLLLEVPGEFAATLGQSFNEWAMLHPDKPIQTWVDSLPQALGETFIATIVGGGAQVGVLKAAQKGLQRFDKKQAQAGAQIDAHGQLEAIAELAKASKVLGRDPEAFQQAIEPMTDGSVYIEARAFSEALAGQGVDPGQAALTSRAVAEQFESALAEGRDIEIPVAEFAAMQQQPFAPALLNHIKLSAGGQTRAELTAQATDADGLKNEVESAVQSAVEPSAADEFKASSGRVQESEFAKMQELGRFNEHQNRLYATASTAFYEQQARRLGVTPEHAQQQYPFFVAREGQGPLEQTPETKALVERQSALEQLAECIG